MSHLLLRPQRRPGQKVWEKLLDPNPTKGFGDSIQDKPPDSIRIYFQNAKGLTYYSTGLEDYYYYVQSLTLLHIDIAGLLETNTAWQHTHLQADYRRQIWKGYRQSRVTYGFPTSDVDKCLENTTYQEGGNLTSSSLEECKDPTGLGRWSGLIFGGKDGFQMTIIMAYQTCSGNIWTSQMGSTYSRE